jgi:hypothetical protein
VHDNATATHCYASFRPSTPNATFYPGQDSPLPCQNDHFGWYFGWYDGIANFSIDLIHTYIDPT